MRSAAAIAAPRTPPAPRRARAAGLNLDPARVRALWAERSATLRRVAALLAEGAAWRTAAELAAALGCREGQAAELADELVNEGAADLHVTGGTWRYAAAGAPVPTCGVTWPGVLRATLRAALGREIGDGENLLALWAAWCERAEQAARPTSTSGRRAP